MLHQECVTLEDVFQLADVSGPVEFGQSIEIPLA